MENIYVMYADLYKTDAEEVEKINGVYKDNSTNFLIIGEETLSVVQNVLKSFLEKYEEDSIGGWLYENGIEGYIEMKYESRDFDILGVSGDCSQFAVLAAADFVINHLDYLENWSENIEKIIKGLIISYVNKEVQGQLIELKIEGYNVDMLKLKIE